jgi:hypothetical protein
MRLAALAALLCASLAAAQAPTGTAVICVAGDAALSLDACTSFSGALRVSAAATAPLLRELRGALQLTAAADDDALLVPAPAVLRGALPALRTVSGDVRVDAAALASLAGAMPRLRSVGGTLRIADASRMLSLDAAWPALETVGGDLLLDGGAWRLLSAGAFRRLRTVGGSVRVSRCPALKALSGAFPRLAAVGGDVAVANASVLEGMTGAFPALRSVGGDLQLLGLPLMSHVSKGTLARLRAVGGALRVERTALHDLAFLASLAILGGPPVIRGNAALRSLKGLQNVRQVGPAADAGGADLQRLSPVFGECGCALVPSACALAAAPPHRCFAAHYRACVATLAGGFACAPTAMTWLNSTVSTSLTARLMRAAGLEDALSAPLADVTVVAPEDGAWLQAYRGGGEAAVAAAAASAPGGLKGFMARYLLRGAAEAAVLAARGAAPSWSGGGVVTTVAGGGSAPPGWLAPRCRGLQGELWPPCIAAAAASLKLFTVYSRDALAAALRGEFDATAGETDLGTQQPDSCVGRCGLCAARCCCDAGCGDAGDCCAGARLACPAIVPADADELPAPPPPARAVTPLLTRLEAMQEVAAQGGRIIQPDLEAINGVVHIIDRVLLTGDGRTAPPPRPPRPPRASPPPAAPPPPPSPPRPPLPPGAQAASLPTDTRPLYGVAAPPPPPNPPQAAAPPPPAAPAGTCVAIAPNICGQCECVSLSASSALFTPADALRLASRAATRTARPGARAAATRSARRAETAAPTLQPSAAAWPRAADELHNTFEITRPAT